MNSFTVKAHGAYITGRNGTFDLRELNIWSDQYAYIDGISKHFGIAVNGGFGRIPLNSMDEVCQKWLEQRGFTVAAPNQDVEPENLEEC